MKKFVCLIFLALFTTTVVGCAKATPTPEAVIKLLKPGDRVGDMLLSAHPPTSMEASIFNYCNPFVSESIPSTDIRQCDVPELPHLSIGFGERASTQEGLEAAWQSKTWELYVDGHPIDLSAFGTIDLDVGEKVRIWNVGLENLTPGLHRVRYISREVDGASEPTDITWEFTIWEQVAASVPPPTAENAAVTEPATPASTGENAVATEPASAENIGQHPYISANTELESLLYLPGAYGKDPQRKWPLIVFLHGSGVVSSDLEDVKFEALPQILEFSFIPTIVLSPHLKGEIGETYWIGEETIDSLFTLLDEIQAAYSVDPKRIYLTGVSIGGNGVWEIGLRYPGRFAALVPVMGFVGDTSGFRVPENICDLKDTPVWAFHGAIDPIVPLQAEEDLVNALKACGGNVQFTVYPDGDHDISGRVYNHNPEFYEWLFAQSLK